MTIKADVVLGQPDFTQTTQYGPVTARVAHIPVGVAIDRAAMPNPLVYVADTGNNRVLVFELIGGVLSGPVRALGQDSPTSGGGANRDSAFSTYPYLPTSSPTTLAMTDETALSPGEAGGGTQFAIEAGGNVWLADFENNRVLRFPRGSSVADVVIGQADFNQNSPNRGNGATCANNSLWFMWKDANTSSVGLVSDGSGGIWVGDSGNRRILHFPSGATVADIVLGQPDFTSNGGPGTGTAPARFTPNAIAISPSTGKMYVCDSAANPGRVLQFTPPFTTNMNAVAFGSGFSWQRPFTADFDPNHDAGSIWITDTLAGTISLINEASGAKEVNRELTGPSVGFAGDGAGTGGSIGIDAAGNIYATLRTQHQVYKWTAGGSRTVPTALLDAVVKSASGFGATYGVAVTSTQLIVADQGRVLFWNDLDSLHTGKPADGYLAGMWPTHMAGGFDYISPVLSDGVSICTDSDEKHLWVTTCLAGDDAPALLCYALPLNSGDTPIYRLANRASPYDTNNGGTINALGGGSITFGTSWGICANHDSSELWIAQTGNNRVLRVRNMLTAPLVDVVLGQADLTTVTANRGGAMGNNTLYHVGAVQFDVWGNLWVSDHALEAEGNKRLLLFKKATIPSGNSTIQFGPNCDKEFPNIATWQPAFGPNGVMIVGYNPYGPAPLVNGYTGRLPGIYYNPLSTVTVPDDFLYDFYSMAMGAVFDPAGRLYVMSHNRNLIRIYHHWFQQPAPSPGGDTTYQDLVLSLGPVAYWRMGEVNGNLADATGHGNTAVANGTPGYMQAGALLSNPEDGAISFPNNGATYFATADNLGVVDQLTILGWIRLTAVGAQMRIITQQANGFDLGVDTTGHIAFAKDAVAFICTSTLALSASEWHMFAYTKDGVANFIYIDGEDVSGGVGNQTLTGPAGAVQIGRNATGGGHPMDGRLDELAVFNYALSGSLIRTIYNAALILPTANEILGALISGQNAAVHWRFVYWQSNHDLALLNDVSEFVESASIDMSVDRAVKKHLSITMRRNSEISELTDHILVRAIITDNHGNEATANLGLYHLNFPKESHDPTRTVWTFDAYDGTIEMQAHQLTEPWVSFKNFSVVLDITLIIEILGVSRWSLPNITATFPSDMSWPIGTSYLDLLTDLCNLAGCYAPWFDENDYLITRQYDDLDRATPGVLYTTDPGISLVLSPFDTETNSEEFANQVIVTSDNPENPITGVATNDDPSSPTSTVRLGYTKTKLLSGPLADQATADMRALIELQRAKAVYTNGRLRTSLDPRRAVHEIYDLSIYNETPYDYEALILSEAVHPCLYWRLGDTGGTFFDRSAYANNGLSVGDNIIYGQQGALLAAEDDGAVLFNDAVSKIECAAALGLPADHILLEFWVWIPATPTATHTLLDVGYAEGAAGHFGYKITLDSDLLLHYHEYDGTTTRVTTVTGTSLHTGARVHIGFVKRFVDAPNTDIRPCLYVDGELWAQEVGGSWGTSWAGLSLPPVRVGPMGDASGIIVDEVIIYTGYATGYTSPRDNGAATLFKRHYDAALRGSGLIADGKWWARGWTMPLFPGATMDHVIARLDTTV